MSFGLSNKPNNTSWMIVYITHNLSEAHIVAGRLEHEGIKTVINHMAGRDAIGITFGSLGEVKILVNPQDYDRAVAIIDPEMQSELPDDTDAIVFGFDDEDAYWDDDDEE
ncbi:MAG: DUF2007 domain-containing protein [Aggregatilineales bacterium]